MGDDYEVYFEAGSFMGPAGAEKLRALVNAYSGAGTWEIVSVVPISKDGSTYGVQIVAKRVRKN